MKRLVLLLLVLLAQTAVFAEDFDVAVIGAGTAGIPAALAAARCGARTVLIETYGMLGGMATTALVSPFMTCYDRDGEGYHYEGIQKGLLARYDSRIRYVEGDVSPLPGVYLIPHRTPGLEALGEKAGMYLLQPDGRYLPDDFRHEQSLVFDTEKGLIIFNSCSHAGADNIVKEVSATFPARPIYAIVGGFHLFATPADEVRAFAERLRDTGVQKVITGHCTGEEAYAILAEVLGDRDQQIYTGLTLEL